MSFTRETWSYRLEKDTPGILEHYTQCIRGWPALMAQVPTQSLSSVLRSDTDAVTTTEAPPVGEKWVRKGAARAALVSSSSLLHARTTRPTSPYSPRFLAMLFLDSTLSVIESKLRIVFFSTPCKRGAKQTTISNLWNMLFKKLHFFSSILEKICPK